METIHNPFRAARAAAPVPGLLEARLRPMTGFEEEFVEANSGLEPSALCNELLARCLVAPGAALTEPLAEVRALTVPERDRALVRLRQLSLGDTVQTLSRCPRCAHENQVSFALSALPLDFPPPPREVRVPLSADQATDAAPERTAVLRTPSAGDQEALLARPAEGAAVLRSALLSRVLVRLGADNGPFSVERIHALPTAVRTAFAAALESALPDFNLRMQVVCEKCSGEFAAPFDISSFFLPSSG